MPVPLLARYSVLIACGGVAFNSIGSFFSLTFPHSQFDFAEMVYNVAELSFVVGGP
jgi:hypothetical protein